MGFIKTILDFKTKFQERLTEIQSTEVEPEKLPIYPQWYMSARLGQPRINFNLTELRAFSKSSWVQMVQSSIKKTIQKTGYKIVLKDEDDSDDNITNYSEDVKKINDFLEVINVNNEDINDLITASVSDITEIDAGAWVKIYSEDSYTKGMIDHVDATGQVVQRREELLLKPYGQRRLLQVMDTDGGMFFKNVDIFKRLNGYYQYSFRHPASSPRYFSNDEICYFIMNRRADSVYGFSPVQSVQQEIEVLMQSTRYNKEFFKNNAIPDGLLAVKNASTESLKKIKTDWKKEFKGKAHKFGFLKADAAELIQFSRNLKDMEWLEGQKWYFHLIFASFGLSPAEAGFYEDSNRSTQEGQERVSIKNAIEPYYDLFERKINREIIPEILQKPDIKVKFKFFTEDKQAEQSLFDQQMEELKNDALTINEYRSDKGKDPVKWGDKPKQPTPFGGFGNPEDPNQDPNQDPNKPVDPKEEEKNKRFRKNFEVYLNDRQHSTITN